jgi:hypothetical protein
LSCMVRLEIDIYNKGYTLSHMARLEVDIYNGGDTLSCLVRLELDIYNGGYTLSCMVVLEVDIYNGGYTLSCIARRNMDGALMMSRVAIIYTRVFLLTWKNLYSAICLFRVMVSIAISTWFIYTSSCL